MKLMVNLGVKLNINGYSIGLCEMQSLPPLSIKAVLDSGILSSINLVLVQCN